MILNRKETALAYRCPACGSTVYSPVGAFSLSGNLFRLRCTCGGSEAVIERVGDDKIRVTVPCPICAKPHAYLIGETVFFEREILLLGCTLSGIDLCFIGREEAIRQAVEESDRELDELLDGTSVESLKNSDGGRHLLTDPQVRDIVTYVVKELEDEGNLHCRCEDGHGDYETLISDDAVTVVCLRCGAKKEIPTDSLDRANAFLEIERLDLD